jgi:ubiquinone/menaquinone biosynthesis C-methylase UbiE
MLNKVLPIDPLPSNIAEQLRSVDNFYVCTKFTEDMVGRPIVKIGKNVYYRFMNFIYLPQPPESLDIEQVKRICDLRLDHINELVDRNHNREIVAAIVDNAVPSYRDATSPVKALDFGCGSGLSSTLLMEYIPQLQIVGVDISEKAIMRSRQQNLTAFLTHSEEPLPFDAAMFDVIFAVFVMHFKIDMSTLIELRRILQTSGKFVFNVYKRDIDGVVEELREAGFGSIEIWNSLFGVDTSHMIVSCGKLPSYKIVYH